MKRISSWLLMLLCGMIILTTSVPPVDDPGTAYNESDGAVTISLPSTNAVTSVAPAAFSTKLLRPSSSHPAVSQETHIVAGKPAPFLYSFQQLLCTFLI